MSSRIDAIEVDTKVNGTPVRAKKPTARKDKPAAQAQPDYLWHWATGGVVLMATMSACLNGYANSRHATVPWAGWVLGVLIPAVVLVLGKVAGLRHRRGHSRQALTVGAVGVGLLFLSVWHCASSISLLTGSPIYLSLPIAVAVDCGLVCCELAALSAEVL